MATTTIELSDRVDRALQELSQQTGQSQEDLIREAVDRYLLDREETAPDDRNESPTNLQSFLQRVEDITANLTEEDLEGLPTDGAVNHDFYIYGWPKREQ